MFRKLSSNHNSYMVIISVDVPKKEIELEIKRGCVGKDSLVEKEDGSKIAICEVALGDYIKTPSGVKRVENIMTGTEPTLWRVRTENRCDILATGDHPFLSEIGYVQMSKLTIGMKVISETGDLVAVSECSKVVYEDKVYGLEVEDTEGFLCSGLVSGTFQTEQRLRSESNKHPKEVKL